MDILRQPPFPFEIFYEGLEPETPYLFEIHDDRTETIIQEAVQTNSEGVLEYTLTGDFEKFDESYSVYIYSMDESEGPNQTVVIDNLHIYRPYINPLSIAETPGEEEEYILLERTARQIIDVITGGFYYKSEEFVALGQGTDYLVFNKRANRINSVYENNVKVYDRINPIDGQHTYFITPDKTAMTIAVNQEYNRLQSKEVRLPLAASDSFMFYGDDYDAVQALTEIKGASMFPKDWDYLVYGEWGWPVVPQDIRDATKMLINDLKCNNISYTQKYISEYQTDQFRVKYSELATRGTGNLLVDKILEPYSAPLYTIGVL